MRATRTLVPEPIGRTDGVSIAPARAAPIALVAALGALSVPVLLDLVQLWRAVAYYSHGFLVPLFSAWLVWDLRRSGGSGGDSAPTPRPDIRRSPQGSALGWGVALGLVALGFVLAGDAAGSLTVRALALPLAATAMACAVLDAAAVARMAFPLGFLILVAPLPEELLPRLSLALQHLAATVTAGVLGVLTVPAAHDNLFIHLDGVTLHVSEACNGLRFLLAMVTIGVAFAGLTVRGWVGRTLIVVLALGAAIVGNLIRVSGTALIAHAWGADAATGFLHVAYGKAVYALMLVPFLAGVLLIRRLGLNRRAAH